MLICYICFCVKEFFSSTSIYDVFCRGFFYHFDLSGSDIIRFKFEDQIFLNKIY
ncbi:hypothetical protein GLOIN_2v1555070 [Rhizophagus irregularis DAOM 181602=DAOM 197198]|uniref:Uncharacterized protein n=1 Tax=Rhizophagus irregularis (strain DAOM 181602 / DAOM 197198 / MUCL 43194) TaxID=747089 RepID=A0A2P4QFW5_RHIID|nr:hypothetical protein GLOIN_2v1555070 [Rhizophagus irregularis DAOM 181602=DAOM 197198]POG76506.1 hypothetical protein GLOIN_2v1555070 [Rhizophagus irregularis DAOM 181602=DAOM 197198]|eukprot:XP_025183372.1 hypothetical protein GLOIN_2v1555070 [Rhizophagus irregularis DAOM 181602=DAOM 197198]